MEVQRKGAAGVFASALIEATAWGVAVDLALGESLEVHDAVEEDRVKGYRDDHGLGQQGRHFDFGYVLPTQEVRRDEEDAEMAVLEGGFYFDVPVLAQEDV